MLFALQELTIILSMWWRPWKLKWGPRPRPMGNHCVSSTTERPKLWRRRRQRRRRIVHRKEWCRPAVCCHAGTAPIDGGGRWMETARTYYSNDRCVWIDRYIYIYRWAESDGASQEIERATKTQCACMDWMEEFLVNLLYLSRSI